MKRILTTGLGATLAAMLAASTAAAEPITFKDHRDQTIELAAPPERLATIIRAAPFIYYSTDRTTEHMVAVNADSIARMKNFIYADLIPELMQLNGTAARDGFAPNVEAILATKPELVIQAMHNPDLIEPLERVGLKVAAWGCCTEEQRLDYIRMSGAISGHPERAEATLIQVIANPSHDFALSGIKNLAADDSGEWWKNVDVEQLFVWNPDMIIIPAQAVTVNPADFYAHPLLSSMDAVKNKRVYKVPKFNASPDSPELFLTAVWLAMVAHPDGASVDADFPATVANAYETIYGRKPDEAQMRAILEIEANSEAPGYAALFE